MSTQSTDSDTENPSDEHSSEEPTEEPTEEPMTGSAYARLLATSSLEELEEKPWEVKLALLQHHLELARIFVGELLEEEVEEKAGERYSHDDSRFSRWGTNPGSVRIGEEKVRIAVPRMMDTETGKTCSPERYAEIKDLPPMSGKMQEAILLGLSQNDYERVASSFVGGFGLSQSAVSERFIERSAKALEEFESRSLEDLDLVALIMDAKHVAGKQMVVALGVTTGGKKIPLSFAEASTEHHEPVKSLLRELIDRGLSYDQGLLFVTDGARGLHKAIREIFSDYALIQRCQWHKRENIVGYLPKSDRKKWRRKLRRAYQKPTYEEAKAALEKLHAELQEINRSAARSLQEGLEETLTLHRLGVFEEVGRSLKTTNAIENLNSLVEDYIGNVKRWHHSEQRARWFALGLLEAEQRMNRIAGHEDLPKLRNALQRELDLEEDSEKEPLSE
ncbi:transposase-like protein [Salinibacter ruber]|uniref:IS256 family transposase n=1 Tax=Salinibacter ruber TaxID=146919 RepID=UPI002166D87D|nr:IS256 family transposase [Salinibacter ruber]MCS4044591.1 transposase-like protein [Salinibacter ruber]